MNIIINMYTLEKRYIFVDIKVLHAYCILYLHIIKRLLTSYDKLQLITLNLIQQTNNYMIERILSNTSECNENPL